MIVSWMRDGMLEAASVHWITIIINHRSRQFLPSSGTSAMGRGWCNSSGTHHPIALLFYGNDQLAELAERLAYHLFVVRLGAPDALEGEDLEALGEGPLGAAQFCNKTTKNCETAPFSEGPGECNVNRRGQQPPHGIDIAWWGWASAAQRQDESVSWPETVESDNL